VDCPPDTARKPRRARSSRSATARSTRNGSVRVDVPKATRSLQQYGGTEIKVDGEELLVSASLTCSRRSSRSLPLRRTTQDMAHKELKYEAELQALELGVDAVGQRRQGHAWPAGPLRGPRQEVGARDYERRRDDRAGDRVEESSEPGHSSSRGATSTTT